MHTVFGKQRTIIALLKKATIQQGMDISTHRFHIAPAPYRHHHWPAVD